MRCWRDRSLHLRGWITALLFAIVGLVCIPLQALATETIPCIDPNKTPARDLCFVEYVAPNTRQVDERLTKILPPPHPGDPEIRTIAVIVSISEYPNFPDPRTKLLSTVDADLPQIISFLREQKFDEIILLRNEKATWDAINNVLSDYIANTVTQYANRSRFLFVFDGHGTKPRLRNLPGGMALSETYGDGDPDPKHSFSLGDLEVRLQTIGSFTYQSLALLGSCFSGGIFPPSPGGGDTYNPYKAGAHAVTAAAADQLAWEHPGGQGTVFFDEFLHAATHEDSKVFDQSSAWTSDETGNSARTSYSIVRLLRVVDDVNSVLESKNNPMTGQPYPSVRIGTVVPNSGYEGAFFFLGQQQPGTVKVDVKPDNSAGSPSIATPLSISGNTGSAILGHPEIKVFNIPEFYKIRGVDLNHFGGSIDFSKLQDAGIRFAYIKASEGAVWKDPRVIEYASSARNQHMDFGIYHVFNFRKTAAAQLENLTERMAAINKELNNPEMLPIAVDLGEYLFAGNPTPSSSDLANLRQFLEAVEARFKKKPILYSPSFVVFKGLGETFNQYSIWLAKYRTGNHGPSLSGNNPWTLWQFTNEAHITGLNGTYDLNAFFGSDEEYKQFKKGEQNVALEAALPAAPSR